MKKSKIFLLVGAVGAIGLAAFLSRQSNPIITLENRSNAIITNVVLSGSGFSSWLGEITADSKRQVSVYPKGESSVRVAFDAAGRHFEKDNLGYIESAGRYRVNLAVEADFKIVARDATVGY